MHTVVLSYQSDGGWSQELPVQLDGPRTLIFIFADPATVDKDGSFWQALTNGFPQAAKIGCTSYAPILNDGLQTGQIVVAVCQFEAIEIGTAVVNRISAQDSGSLGRQLGQQLTANGAKPRFVFVVGDDRISGIVDLVNGLNAVVPQDTVVSGGLAGHVDYASGQRKIFTNDQIMEDAVAAVGLYGEGLLVQRDWTVGFQHSSPPYKVTRTEGKRLLELSGQSALKLYDEFLGILSQYEDKTLYTIFPVGFYDSPDGDLKVIRSVVGLDEEAGALQFAAEIPAAPYARMMSGLPDNLVTAAGQVALNVQTAGPPVNGEQLHLMVSCVSRFASLLKTAKNAEIRAAYARLRPNAHMVGYYAGGEIGDIGGECCGLLNHTVNLIGLSEA